MNRELHVVKETPYQSPLKQDEKSRLLERIYRLYEDTSNGNMDLEGWQKEEADILITKWRSI